MPLFKKQSKTYVTGRESGTDDLEHDINIWSSKLKKVIRLSPSTKKKHSKARVSTEMDGSVPGSSGTTSAKNGTSKAKGNQRVPNGLSDIDNSLQQAFDMFDKNHDGKISCEELGCVLRTLGYKPTPAEIEDMIKNVDTNENGYVEFEEFLNLMSRHSDKSTLELLDPYSLEAKKREAFRVFDMDGNGYIDKHELKCVMGRLGEHLSDEDIKAMFNEADLNGDGLIDFEDALKSSGTDITDPLKPSAIDVTDPLKPSATGAIATALSNRNCERNEEEL